MSYGLGAYKKTSIHTASKEQILIMLYQAAIKNCKKAIESIEENNIAKKGEFIGKLQDIVIELNNSLDLEVGGDVAKELSSL
ncbi:MAG: flagellar export chaperone FliS, partial [Deltaproteobacteria bacterium]